MNGERYRGANLGFGPSMQHEPAPGPRTRVEVRLARVER
jgi:hypothetical protein